VRLRGVDHSAVLLTTWFVLGSKCSWHRHLLSEHLLVVLQRLILSLLTLSIVGNDSQRSRWLEHPEFGVKWSARSHLIALIDRQWKRVFRVEHRPLFTGGFEYFLGRIKSLVLVRFFCEVVARCVCFWLSLRPHLTEVMVLDLRMLLVLVRSSMFVVPDLHHVLTFCESSLLSDEEIIIILLSNLIGISCCWCHGEQVMQAVPFARALHGNVCLTMRIYKVRGQYLVEAVPVYLHHLANDVA